MGLISFTMLIVKEYYPSILSNDGMLMFELAHVWLFLIGLMYVIYAVILCFTSFTAVSEWYIAENTKVDPSTGVPEVKLARERQAASSQKSSWNLLRCLSWLSEIFKFFLSCARESMIRSSQANMVCEFMVIRDSFVGTWSEVANLNETFHFAEYLRKFMNEFIESSMVVTKGTWALLLLALFVNIARVSFKEDASFSVMNELVLWCVLGWATLVVNIITLIALQYAKKNLLKKNGVLYDGLETEAAKSNMLKKAMHDSAAKKLAALQSLGGGQRRNTAAFYKEVESHRRGSVSRMATVIDEAGCPCNCVSCFQELSCTSPGCDTVGCVCCGRSVFKCACEETKHDLSCCHANYSGDDSANVPYFGHRREEWRNKRYENHAREATGRLFASPPCCRFNMRNFWFYVNRKCATIHMQHIHVTQSQHSLHM